MKASILKKLNIIIEEANSLKNKNKFEKALNKFQEAINFINLKVGEPEDKKIEIQNIKNAINQTYSVQIDQVIEDSIHLTAQKEFKNAKESFQNALKIAKKIDDADLRDTEIEEINLMINENELEQIINEGVKLREEKNFDKAIETFKKGISIAEDNYNKGSKPESLVRVNNEISLTYGFQIRLLVDKATDLKDSGNYKEAIKIFEESLAAIEKYLDAKTRRTEIINIKNMINEIYSNQIKPLVEKGKKDANQGDMNAAISEFKNALNISSKMFESDLKNLEIRLIAEALNPIYIERTKPIIEDGTRIIQQERFEESMDSINKVVNVLNEALEIANSMVKSEKKEKKLEEIRKIINNACLAGIKVIKDRSLQFVVQKKYDDAIGELYSALSIAKNMVYPENNNPELDSLKDLVNNVYTAEVEEIINKGNKIVEQKEFQDAIAIFNEALNLTNKMYLTDEMEKIVNMIKGIIYETEVKLLVGKGESSEEKKVKEKEIERLKKRLDYANSIEDPDRRQEEMNKVKKMIDAVHSEEIKLLIEQGNQLAEGKVFDDAFEFYEKALKINEMMAEPDIKNKDLVKNCYKRELINKAKQEIDKKDFKNAIESCNRAIELDKNFLDGYYCTGIAYSNERKYDMAIKSFEKAVSLDPNHIDSWNNIGVAYEHLNNLDKAKHAYEKTLEINPDYYIAFFNIANIFKQTESYDEAIENYTKATNLKPDFAKAWFFMGCSYFDKKEYNEAIIQIKKAIKLDPNLAQDVNPLINDLNDTLDKLKESLSFSFIDR